MIANKNYKFLSYLFGCFHIFIILTILSQGAVEIVTNWKAAIYIVIPCAVNVLFALSWMIGAGLQRPAMIRWFQYFCGVQLVVIAALTMWYAIRCYTNAEEPRIHLMTFVVLSLFLHSTIELIVAIGAHRAVVQEQSRTRMQAYGMPALTEDY
ncbi:uncharacterized protein LOC129769683 isoform X3 [Toxorhynchites rutilus septentrionalis]|uniref:uncharacterized protein LOC129769683 isoform X3 n=1 Tax=Toxorhynchites rutilus septentrionalis TaxID=329112 RepID=UPI00247A1574|nr:uncharacterized protein LOC129769683 isoform X3 [Toxorhynchites rutilus septentrionalis]XP_055628069.1 uncharacterized protein LOC129769683 isoform X3 [Toxorhynchites rutilus septentrionalis]